MRSISGCEVGALFALLHRGPAVLAVGVDDRELDLVAFGAEIHEKFVDLVDDFVDAGVGTVDLVDDQDHRQAGFERLAEHETGLRQRPFGGVDQQDDTVDHGQAAFDLTAEVGVAGRVDDVHLHVSVADRGVLGEDGDALFALEIHRVHDPLVDVLALAEGARTARAWRRPEWSCRGPRGPRSRYFVCLPGVPCEREILGKRSLGAPTGTRDSLGSLKCYASR